MKTRTKPSFLYNSRLNFQSESVIRGKLTSFLASRSSNPSSSSPKKLNYARVGVPAIKTIEPRRQVPPLSVGFTNKQQTVPRVPQLSSPLVYHVKSPKPLRNLKIATLTLNDTPLNVSPPPSPVHPQTLQTPSRTKTKACTFTFNDDESRNCSYTQYRIRDTRLPRGTRANLFLRTKQLV